MPRPTGSASQRCGGENNHEQLIEDALHTIETKGISLATTEKCYTIPKQTLGHRRMAENHSVLLMQHNKLSAPKRKKSLWIG